MFKSDQDNVVIRESKT